MPTNRSCRTTWLYASISPPFLIPSPYDPFKNPFIFSPSVASPRFLSEVQSCWLWWLLLGQWGGKMYKENNATQEMNTPSTAPGSHRGCRHHSAIMPWLIQGGNALVKLGQVVSTGKLNLRSWYGNGNEFSGTVQRSQLSPRFHTITVHGFWLLNFNRFLHLIYIYLHLINIYCKDNPVLSER